MTTLNRFGAAISSLLVAVLFFSISRTPHAGESRLTGGRAIIPLADIDAAGEDPNARARYEWLRLHDPATGIIPSAIRDRELAYSSTLPKRENLAGSALGKTGSTAVTSWNERGPHNIGGRTRALAYDVSDSTTILAGGVSGGMWRSTDGGSTWTKTTSSSSLQSVSCLAQDTRSSHRSTWYYGTGEYLGNSAYGGGNSFYNGDGIFKSIDDGLSWTQLASTSAGTPQTFTQFFDYVWNIVVDPSNSSQDEVYAATYGAIYRSTNGGTNWSIVLGGSSPYSNMTDVQVTSTGVVYAAASSGSTMSGIWWSTDGTSWTNITPAGFPSVYGRIVIGVAPSNENVVYFLVQGTNGTNGSDQINSHQFWKYSYLTGNGAGSNGTWVNRGINLPNESGLSGNAKFDTQGGYDMLVRVKPDDSSFVIIGGTNLYRTTDAFATNSNWSRIGGYSSPSTYALYTNHHPDQHAGVFKPGSNVIFVSGDDGGVQRTLNVASITVSWAPLNNGYFTTQFYAIAIDHGTSGDNTIVGGMQDNGTWRTTSNNPFINWSNEFSGDGAFCAIADGGGSLYVSSQNSVIYRITSSGFVRIDPTGGTGYLFVNPFILDPNNNSTVYLAGGILVWRNSDITGILVDGSSTTKSTNWTSLTNTGGSGGTISALAASKSSANRLYYGTSNGKVFRIDAANIGNPSPTDIWSGKGFPFGAYVNCIAVGPDGGDSAIVVFSNYSVISLFRTTDAGSSWSNISGNLEQNANGSGNGPSCRWATVLHGSASTHYYVGTSTGVYSTTLLNGTSTVWSQEGSSEIGNVVTDMVDVRENDGTVIAATHGNGVFSATIYDALPVEISSLAVSAERKKTLITWSTATETNSYEFGIERAVVGNALPSMSGQSVQNWSSVGFVKGAGTSISLKQYTFEDQPPAAGTYAYRIKLVDQNGSFRYSAVTQVDIGVAPKEFSLSQNYPNPFNPSTTIEFTIPEDGKAKLVIYNVLGQEVETILDQQLKAGEYHQAIFNATRLSSGMYISVLRFNNKQLVKKMLLLK